MMELWVVPSRGGEPECTSMMIRHPSLKLRVVDPTGLEPVIPVVKTSEVAIYSHGPINGSG